ncbi:hypothetical protein QJ857_gp0096 [Tupanvirus soda lake]|uniref:Uncharacterized protein n=2 Tax=Tupanvirus TaxID=2094720 RepID=A0A6N1NUD0_9VIRU|nr:hypothetical protein QJ857_gp0096 [Tupanvirus soda lake]QKU35927.1 hypothetical protein [Tupanvirus soda lake]
MAVAAPVLMRRYSEEERETNYKKYKQNKKNDNTLLMLNKSTKAGIYYGYMEYYVYYNHGIYLTDYKIYDTSDNIDKIISGIQNILIWAIENKSLINLLLYQVENIDPQLVSYDIIKSFNFPWCKIKINGKNKNICSFCGDENLFKEMYQKIDLLNDYEKYHNHVKALNKSDLKNLFEKVFNKRVPFILNKRSRMIKELTNQKKFELIETYRQP